MSALTDRPPRAPSDGITSNLDRVRVRMKRLMHGRDRASPLPGDLARGKEPPAATKPVAAPGPCPLSAEIRTLQEALEDSEQLIRQAWIVAADLNQMRRRCNRCESIGALPEPLGMFQGLLNRWRQNLRTEKQAVDNIRAAVSVVRDEPKPAELTTRLGHQPR